MTFVDASQQAYGAAVYIRCKYHNDAVTSRLIAVKSKVAPLTPMTVPRLELMGAILGLRLTQSLLTVLEVPMQSVTFYSDSTGVLWCIRGRGKDFRPFVANRIGEIQMFTEPSQWQHVSTEQNPADLCTRGATPSGLAECSMWWNGPDWLTKDSSEWSKMLVPNRPSEMPEMKTSKRKEGANASATLVTNSLQKEAAPRRNNTCEVWRRWLKECVPALNSRPKWTSANRDLKVDEVVLVIQPDSPRGRWPLGRVTEVYPGQEGHTRVAKDCRKTNYETDSAWN